MCSSPAEGGVVLDSLFGSSTVVHLCTQSTVCFAFAFFSPHHLQRMNVNKYSPMIVECECVTRS